MSVTSLAPTDVASARAAAGQNLADALEATLCGVEAAAPYVVDLRSRLLRAQARIETSEAQLADASALAERERQAALRAEKLAEAARADGRVASQHAAAARAAADKALADTTAAKKEVDAVTKSMEGVAVAPTFVKKNALVAAVTAPSSPKPTADARPKLRAAASAAIPASAHLTFQRTLLDESCDGATAAQLSFRDALLIKAEAEHVSATAAASHAAALAALTSAADEVKSRAAAFEADLAAASTQLEQAAAANGALIDDVERLRGFVDDELDALAQRARAPGPPLPPRKHLTHDEAAAAHAPSLPPSPSAPASPPVARIGESSAAAARLLASHDLVFAVRARCDAHAAVLAWVRLCVRSARGRDGAAGLDPPLHRVYDQARAEHVASLVSARQLSPAAGAFFAFCSASLRAVSLPVDAVLPLDEAPFAAALAKLDGFLHLVRGEARDAAAAVVGADGWLSFELFEAAMKQSLKKPSYLPLGAEGLTVMRWRTLLAWAIKVDFRG